MNGYNLSRAWYSFKFSNPGKTKSIHSDLYHYIIDLWNRLGQKESFGLPTLIAMESLNIGSYNTYKKALNDLIDFGFIILVKESKNQHQSKIIALSKNDKATDEPLDKATIKATDEATDEPLDKAVDSIIEQLNNITTKQLNKEQITNILLSVRDFNKKFNTEIEIDLKPKEIKEKIPFQEIVDIFHSVCVDLPRLKTLNEKRKNSISKIIKEYSLESLGEVFQKVNESDFLSGRKTEWKSSFDWVINPINFVKILEDNYKNNKNGGEKSSEQVFRDAIESKAAQYDYFK